MNITLKRISAYIIDYLFIILMITLVSQIKFINPKYDKYIETLNEYNVLYEEILDNNISIINSSEFTTTYYNLEKYGLSTSISTIVIYLLYFVGFQKWNNYQTLGKKVFNIKIVSEKKISWLKMLLRSIISYNLIFQILSILALFILNENNYLIGDILITIVGNIFLYLNLFMIIFNKKHLGIHDIICKTEIKEV